MRILRADKMGLCFGVRDALAAALARSDPERFTVHGELVHNPLVNDRLRDRGYELTAEHAREGLPERPGVLITAHGVSDRERQRLTAHGKQIVDTTCPLVRRAHEAAVSLAAAGWHVVVIGKRGHVEVRGLVGDLPHWDVAGDVASVGRYEYPRIAVLCQTTCPEQLAQEVLAEIRACNPTAEIRFVDTICEPTRQRIRAVEALAPQVDVMVVVGGANSNNTRQLVRLAAGHGVPTHHVQGPADLDPDWFADCATVGLTAGTSTLDETVDAVESAIADSWSHRTTDPAVTPLQRRSGTGEVQSLRSRRSG